MAILAVEARLALPERGTRMSRKILTFTLMMGMVGSRALKLGHYGFYD